MGNIWCCIGDWFCLSPWFQLLVIHSYSMKIRLRLCDHNQSPMRHQCTYHVTIVLRSPELLHPPQLLLRSYISMSMFYTVVCRKEGARTLSAARWLLYSHWPTRQCRPIQNKRNRVGARMVGALVQENFGRPQISAPVFYLICFAFTRYNKKKNYIYILFIW